ncbi:ATP-binding cassette domain-containing protein [Streptomyces sp. Ru87]|uniref:ATP-binding cassette domain-containing protein n=1 Tax=Streptomyces sp. Ru87 TaxID=2044307 RepID=UPI000BF28CD9|nr:ATP-binding cassette domain-containing protein [Streptomyces sp. Ru87]PGH50600.1 ABC transporter ATP-binding protein [Streptomyces sp. Ru87]
MTPGRPAGPGPARIRPARRARGPLRRVLPRARRFLGARKRVLVTLGGWSLLESAHTFLGGYGVAQALDRGFLDGDPGTGLAWLAVAAVAIVVGGLANRGVFRGLADLVEPLRDGLLRRVVGTALRDAVADPARSGDSAVVSRLTHQTETARDSFAGLVLVARSFLFTSAGALAGLAALAPLLLVVVLPPLLLGLALFLATLLPMAARQQDYLRADEDLAEAYGAVATGLRDVVACGAEDRAEDRTGRLADAEVRAARSLARWAAARTLSLGVAGQLPVLLLVLATPWLLRGGVTAGELLGALTYLTQSLLPALQTLMTALGAAGTRLLVILDRLMGGADEERTGPAAAPRGPADPEPAFREPASGEPAPREPARRGSAPREPALAPRGAALTSPGRAPGRSGSPRTPVRPAFAPVPPAPSVPSAPSAPSASATPGAPPVPAVELRSVTFAYGAGAHPVLRDLDLAVAPGEHLVVVGPSGIGKSTLTGLVAGLLVPDRGEVRVGGRPARISPSAADAARERVLIPQQAYVFTGTLRENLLYLCPDGAPDAAVLASAEAVGLGPVAERIGGLDAVVDPAVLSQGERQLVALARAHLAPAPLVLLDEATCHLDPVAEERAERAFARRPGTLIVVAHRISSARRADRVLVMDGVHAVCGRHEELPARSDLYRDLVGRWHTARL